MESQLRTSSIFFGAMHKFDAVWGVCLSIHNCVDVDFAAEVFDDSLSEDFDLLDVV